jgi:hypothetical protein
MKAAIIGGTIATVLGGIILYMFGFQGAPVDDSFDPAASPSPEPVTFYVSGRRSGTALSVQATVTIDGEHAGVITVDQTSPTDEISHTVPRPGTYSYSVETVATTVDAYGTYYEHYGSGQGSIEVEQGSTFEVRATGPVSGNTYPVALVED